MMILALYKRCPLIGRYSVRTFITLDINYGSHESLHCLFNSDCSVLVDEGTVRVDGLVVKLAVLVLHGVDDVPPALQRQLDAQMGPPVTTRHHCLDLFENIYHIFIAIHAA